jgi:hypothetical protein
VSRLRINGEGWAKIGASFLGGTALVTFGAGTFREAAVIVPSMWLVIFAVTGGKPTRVMTSDMLDGFDADDEREVHDRRAKRYGWLVGVILVVGLGWWIFTSPTPYD